MSKICSQCHKTNNNNLFSIYCGSKFTKENKAVHTDILTSKDLPQDMIEYAEEKLLKSIEV